MLGIVGKLGVLAILLVGSSTVLAQTAGSGKFQTQELSETTGVPVLLEHLPDWESHRSSAVFAATSDELKASLGARRILDSIEFTPGTEAVSANYDAGKLVIIEYASPELSSEVDKLASENVDSTSAYRRIGNYNVFVFDVTDAGAANALMDQVKYEKDIQWLGKNPFRISPERAFALTAADIFTSTLYVILIGIGFGVIGGIAAGFLFFNSRKRHLRSIPTFSDAGGMTRLNLDGLTPDNRLLGE